MTKNNNQKIAEIKAIHNEYVKEINKLREEQNKIVAEFIKKLEEKKMDKIRSLIKGI